MSHDPEPAFSVDLATRNLTIDMGNPSQMIEMEALIGHILVSNISF